MALEGDVLTLRIATLLLSLLASALPAQERDVLVTDEPAQRVHIGVATHTSKNAMPASSAARCVSATRR